MKTRKFLAALLAATCAASLAVPAFADDPIDAKPIAGEKVDGENASKQLAEWKMEVTSALQSATLDVTLPNKTSVIINPYRMGITTDDAGTKSFETVLSPEMEIKNDSECAIMVGVKGQVTTYQQVALDESNNPKGYTALPADAKADEGFTAVDLIQPDGNKITISSVTDILVDSTGKNYCDAKGYVLTVKYTATTYTDEAKTTVKKAGSLTVTGYTANKDIKVATAALKNVDTDATNSMFVYAQGTLTQGVYAGIGSKAEAATSAKPAGQLVFTGNKDAEGKVLYLGGSETGYVKISGDVTTAPKTSWDAYDGLFATPFVFQIQAVANKKPVDPNVTALAVEKSGTTATLSTYAFDAKTDTYEITWTGAAASESLTFKPTESTGATVTAVLSGSEASMFTLDDSDTSAIKVTANNGSAVGTGNKFTVEVTFTNVNATPVTYTYNVTMG